jgi:hypothetical protein
VTAVTLGILLLVLRTSSNIPTGNGYLTMSPSAQGPSAWRKSSKCANSECVEIAREQDMILVRDSKSPQASVLRYTREEFAAFLDGAKAGEFDDLI